MRSFRYSVRADADMVGIARYSRERFGDAQTERYLTQIEAAISKAVEIPGLMRVRPELGEGIFAARCGSHIAFLTRPANTWLVIAVLHSRMDPARHLDPKQSD
ncbi:MAG: type II toxin-antitoxin system RelE/ParE family toxin [Hyphomonadaceae bacterium]